MDKILQRFGHGLGALDVKVELGGREFDARVDLIAPRRVISLHRVTWTPHYCIPGRREQETFRSVSANHKTRAALDARVLALLDADVAAAPLYPSQRRFDR